MCLVFSFVLKEKKESLLLPHIRNTKICAVQQNQWLLCCITLKWNLLSTSKNTLYNLTLCMAFTNTITIFLKIPSDEVIFLREVSNISRKYSCCLSFHIQEKFYKEKIISEKVFTMLRLFLLWVRWAGKASSSGNLEPLKKVLLDLHSYETQPDLL